MPSQQFYRRAYLSSLLAFLIAALYGLLLRYAFIGDIPDWISYKFFQHGHSHVAMLGWVYAGLYLAIISSFDLLSPGYKKLYWLSQLAVLGMAIAFPLQGYALISIFFSTAHIILNYVFAGKIWRDLRKHKSTHSTLLLKTSLWMLVISTLGTWALGAIMNTSYKGTGLYYGAIQFYLHFQFNGWFIFSLLAIFFRILEKKKITINKGVFKRFYYTSVVSTLFTFALAVSWSTPIPIIFLSNSIGVIIQLIALAFFAQLIYPLRKQIAGLNSSYNHWLWILSLSSISIKILIQSLVAIPSLAIVSYTIRNFVIGFVHLLMIGGISAFLFAMIRRAHPTISRKTSGTNIFIVGFVVTELLLFGQGIALWMQWGFLPSYHLMIFVASALLPIGVFYILTPLLSRR